MKAALSWLYHACAVLAGGFMIAIAGFVLASVGGGIFGYVARSADEFAGYCMAAASFLALAHTFGMGEHIRVGLLLQRLHGRSRRLAEIWCLLMGALLSGYLAWFSVRLVYVSWQLGELSQGLVAVPLWIPQLGMATGAVVFCIAVTEKLVDMLRGGPAVEHRGDSVMADR